MSKGVKPLGGKAYCSIGHLPGSRLGPGDHSVPQGQADICTVKTRDKHDTVIVQEKLDGSCTAVAKVDGKVLALLRAGYLAESSPYEQHHMFADWVRWNEKLFDKIINEGERFVGEWCAQAHGIVYERLPAPWFCFDIMQGKERATYGEFLYRTNDLHTPTWLFGTGAVPVSQAMSAAAEYGTNYYDPPEGVVYRVERHGKVDFLAKYVRHDKVDGCYLPEISGKPAVWNWGKVA